jgi:hypothetical protein
MSIPIDIHYEAQYATSNRAKCKICGGIISKGSLVLKVLGHHINHTLHPECITRLINLLGDKDVKAVGAMVLRSSGEGIIKVGMYEKVEGRYRWKTITKVNVKGEPDGGTSV